MTCEEIFTNLAEHQIKGMMVHEQLANYYDFLGLPGYRNCHEYHFMKERQQINNSSAEKGIENHRKLYDFD